MKRAQHIEVLARGVLVRDGQLLVCQSKGAANTYLPGGHVEWRERAPDSLRREIEEELGVQARIGRFLGAVEHTFVQKGERHCEINLVFLMTVPGLSPRTDPPACEDWITFRWIPLGRLGANHLEPWPLRKLLPAWLKAKSVSPGWGSTLV